MSARRATLLLVASLSAAVFLALPAGASAGTSSVSSVDAVSHDVSTDGKANTTSSSTVSSSKDSPTTTSYGGGSTDSVPPPADCGSSDSGSSGTTSSSTTSGGSGTTTTSCKPIVECSAQDTDGKDATGKPCVTETCTEGGGVTGGGNGTTTSTVCGGGETPAEEELPEPVVGGGDPEPVETIGGGGPELPFTGLPLYYVIYFGIALVVMGAALWIRSRFGNDGA